MRSLPSITQLNCTGHNLFRRSASGAAPALQTASVWPRPSMPRQSACVQTAAGLLASCREAGQTCSAPSLTGSAACCVGTEHRSSAKACFACWYTVVRPLQSVIGSAGVGKLQLLLLERWHCHARWHSSRGTDELQYTAAVTSI